MRTAVVTFSFSEYVPEAEFSCKKVKVTEEWIRLCVVKSTFLGEVAVVAEGENSTVTGGVGLAVSSKVRISIELGNQ